MGEGGGGQVTCVTWHRPPGRVAGRGVPETWSSETLSSHHWDGPGRTPPLTAGPSSSQQELPGAGPGWPWSHSHAAYLALLN